MSRPKIHEHWRDRIRMCEANEPSIATKKIADLLKAEHCGLLESEPAKAALVGLSPAARTVDRYRSQDAFPAVERTPYRLVYWPESFERGDLPWEAALSALRLLKVSFGKKGARPTVRFVRWYWRVSQSAPELRDEEIQALAFRLSANEQRDDSEKELRERETRDTEQMISGLTQITATISGFGLAGMVLQEMNDESVSCNEE